MLCWSGFFIPWSLYFGGFLPGSLAASHTGETFVSGGASGNSQDTPTTFTLTRSCAAEADALSKRGPSLRINQDLIDLARGPAEGRVTGATTSGTQPPRANH